MKFSAQCEMSAAHLWQLHQQMTTCVWLVV